MGLRPPAGGAFVTDAQAVVGPGGGLMPLIPQPPPAAAAQLPGGGVFLEGPPLGEGFADAADALGRPPGAEPDPATPLRLLPLLPVQRGGGSWPAPPRPAGASRPGG